MNRFYIAAVAAMMSAGAFAADGFVYTVDPAPGEVTELTEFKIIADDYVELESLAMGDLMVKKDGVNFSGIRVNASYFNAELTVKLKTPAIEAGTYVLEIPANSIGYYWGEIDDMTGEYEYYAENPEPITLTWTIKKVVTDTGLDFTTEPAENSTVEDLSKIVLNANPELYSSIARTATEVLFNVLKDGQQFTTATCAGEGLSWTFTLEEAPTEAGEYTLEIPGGAFSATKKGETTSYNVTDAYTCKYKFVPPAEPVVYDLEVYGSKPGNNSVIDLAEQEFSIFIYSDKPSFNADQSAAWPKPAADAKIIVKANDGSWEGEAPLKYSFTYQMWAHFDNLPKYDGEYTIIVPQGSYGDEAWLKNPELGHANAEWSTTFNVVGIGVEGGVVYTLQPEEILPAGEKSSDLSVITVKFPAGTKMKEGTTAYLANTIIRYEAKAEGVEAGDGVFTFTFNPAPTDVNYVYSFTIERGAFGDETYMEDNSYGVASATVGGAWELTQGGGGDNPDNPDNPDDPDNPDNPDNPDGPGAVNVIDAETAEGYIFNLHGQRIENPTSGLYIVNGKKVVIR